MRRKKWMLGLAALAVVWCLGAPDAQAQLAPAGWIRPGAWNFLGPLVNDYGAGPGEAAMKQNWIYPHVIGDPAFNPKSGDVTPIDFSLAYSTRLGLGALTTDAIWTSLDFLAATFPVPGFTAGLATLATSDVVAYDTGSTDAANVCNTGTGVSLVELVNRHLVPTIPGAVAASCLVRDNALIVATTYVNNVTGAPLAVDFCTSSDDSIQAWVNNKCITNRSIPRGTAGDCSERFPAVLPPGISRISVLVWEGGGGWGFRLALEIDGVKLIDGNGMVTFLGHGFGNPAAVAQEQFCLTRSVPLEKNCPANPAEPLKVTLAAMGPGADTDVLTVTEAVTGPSAVTVANVSNGGVVEVGKTSISATGQDIWDGCDDFLFDYDTVSGDFDVSIKFLARKHLTGGGRWGKFGIMARASLADNAEYSHAQDHLPDRQDATRHAGRRGPGGNNCGSGAMFEVPAVGHPTYQRLTRRGTVIQMWTSNDPAVEATPTNDALWTAGHAEDWAVGHATVPPPTDLLVGFANSEHDSEGTVAQTILYRVLSGGPFASSALVGTSEGPSVSTVGARITWTVTRAALRAGLCYDVSFGIDGATTHCGAVAGEAVTNSTVSWRRQTGQVGVFQNSHDVGTPAFLGSTTYDGPTDTYTIKGSGDDIWNNNDRMQMAYKCVSGDFDVCTRVTARIHPNAGNWGRHGIMARYTCDANSKFSAIFTLAGADGSIDTPRHQFRSLHLRNTGNNNAQAANDFWIRGYPNTGNRAIDRRPTWMRLVRKGTIFYSYLSFEDGAGEPRAWFRVGFDDHGAKTPNEMLVCLVSGSHSSINVPAAQTLVEIHFDSFKINAPDRDRQYRITGEIASVDYDDPADLGITVVRSGAFTPQATGGRLRLTDEAVASSATMVWYGVPADPGVGGVDLLNNGFIAEFDAYMTKAGLIDHADGMTFAAVSTSVSDALVAALEPSPPGLDLLTYGGDGGGSLGYAGGTMGTGTGVARRGFPSFSIEMDNWVGGGNNEPPDGGRPNAGAWHAGINIDGTVNSLQTNVQFGVPTASLPNIFAATGVHMEVVYRASGWVSVFATANDGSVARTKILERCIVPLLPGDLVLGFTAGTGGATSTQEIDNLRVSSLLCGETFQVNGDCNQDGGVDIGDVICQIKLLFAGFLFLDRTPQAPTCETDEGTADVNDVNGDELFNASDILYVANWLFRMGPAPVKGVCYPTAGCALSSVCPVIAGPGE